MKEKLNLFWFRRDLRLDDNHAFFKALKSGLKVLPIFIFDEEILSKLPSKSDAGVEFIFQQLELLNKRLEKTGKGIQYITEKFQRYSKN